MPKMKSHKGLLKRIRITGKGKVKFKKAFSGHLRSHKSGKQVRELRLKSLMKSGDAGRLTAMLGRRVYAGDAGPRPVKKSEAVASSEE